jgi:hypothetical protein
MSDLSLRQALTRLLLINEIAAEASASIDRRRVAAVLHRHAQSLLDVEDALLVLREPGGSLRLVIPETREAWLPSVCARGSPASCGTRPG